MRCSKGLRNGPCGGSSNGKCYAQKETRPCAWHLIFEEALKKGKEGCLLQILPPLDGKKTGRSAWLDLAREIRREIQKVGLKNVSLEKSFDSLHCPDWWKRILDCQLPERKEPVSELERALRAGEFVITRELKAGPFNELDASISRTKGVLKEAIVNSVSNPSAIPKIDSLASSIEVILKGGEPILQMSARDTRRNTVYSIAIGAFEHGVRNILCVTGDSSNNANDPISPEFVIDVDSVQMLCLLRAMQAKVCLSGDKIENQPEFFLGAAASILNPKFSALRTKKKVIAGAQFIQTNLVFDVELLEAWLDELDKLGILNKFYIIVGITPLKSLNIALNISKNVPGVFVPEGIIERMKKAKDKGGKEEEKREGLEIALEIIKKVKGLYHRGMGVNGIHLMPVFWEDISPEIILRAGLAD